MRKASLGDRLRYGVVLHPRRAAPITRSASDRAIVLAEA